MSGSINAQNDNGMVVIRIQANNGDWMSVSLTSNQAEDHAKGVLAAVYRARGGTAPEGAPIGTIEMRSR